MTAVIGNELSAVAIETSDLSIEFQGTSPRKGTTEEGQIQEATRRFIRPFLEQVPEQVSFLLRGVAAGDCQPITQRSRHGVGNSVGLKQAYIVRSTIPFIEMCQRGNPPGCLDKLTIQPAKPSSVGYDLVSASSFGRRIRYVAVGGLHRNSDKSVLLPSNRFPFERLRPDSMIGSGLINAALPLLSFLTDLAVPCFRVPVPAPVEFVPNSRWSNMCQGLFGDPDAYLLISAKRYTAPSELLRYIRIVSKTEGIVLPSVYQAILANRSIYSVVAHVRVGSGRSLVQARQTSPSVDSLSPLESSLVLDCPFLEQPECFASIVAQAGFDPNEQDGIFQLPTLYTLDETLALLQFAYSEDEITGMEQTRLDPYVPGGNFKSLGNGVRFGDNSPVESYDSFRAHCLIVGRPNMGKSSTICHLVNQLSAASHCVTNSASFLIVDAVKGDVSEYFHKRGFPLIDVAEAPLPINLFVPEDHERVDQRTSLIANLFSIAFPTNDYGVAEWQLMLRAVYKTAAERVSKSPIPDQELLMMTGAHLREESQRIPTIQLLQDAGSAYLAKLSQGGDRFGFERRAYYMHAIDAVSGILGYLFFKGDWRESRRLFDESLAVSCERISDRILKRSIIIGIFLALREHRKEQRCQGQEVNHFSVFDEAHFVAPSKSSNHQSQTLSSEDLMANLICDGARELRGYGESLIFADQSPSEVALPLLRNCGVFVCHALQERQDREVMKDLMLLDESQTRELSRLQKREIIVSIQGRDPYRTTVQDIYS